MCIKCYEKVKVLRPVLFMNLLMINLWIEAKIWLKFRPLLFSFTNVATLVKMLDTAAELITYVKCCAMQLRGQA